MGKVDYSLIRFMPTLAEAKRIFSPQNGDYTLNQYTQVLLRPSEAYFQITNFNQNYYFTAATGMFVVDCAGNVLADVTDDTDFIILTDIDGFPQIGYEVGFLDFDFFAQPVLLKLVTDTYEFFSSPVTISNQFDNEYLRVEYLYYGMSFELGIDFNNELISGKFQTIGLRGAYRDIDIKRTDKGYTQMSTALEVTSKVLDTPFFKFIMEYSSPFSYLQATRVFSADVINIGWGEYLPMLYRVTNKPAQEAEEVLGSSNLKKNGFDCCLDLGETKVWTPQLLPAFTVIDRFPLPDTYTGFNFTGNGMNLMRLTFNRDIAPVVGFYSVKLFKDGVLILTVPYPGIAIDGVSQIDFTGDLMQISFLDQIFYDTDTGTPNNGTYDVVVQPLYDSFGSEWSGYAIGDWRIIIADGDYSGCDYEAYDYITIECADESRIHTDVFTDTFS